MLFSMSDEAFKKAVADNSLVIDCKEIRLAQNGVKTPRILHGNGSLFFNKTKGIEARFISGSVSPPDSRLKEFFADISIRSGQLIPDSHYFSLCAIDAFGQEWTCPSVSVKFDNFDECTVVNLTCGWLKQVSYNECSQDSVHMMFLENLNFPLNVLEKRTIERGDKKSTNITYTVSESTLSSGIQLRYGKAQNETEWYELIAKCPPLTKLPLNYELRLIETIRFISATAISYSVCETILNGTKTLELSATRPLSTGIFPPPLPTRRDITEDFYNLFDCYIQYVSSVTSSEEFSTLTTKIGGLHQLKDVSLDAVALLVSVAIEGITQHEFKSIGHPSESIICDLEKIITSINSLDIDDSVRNRSLGSLSGIKSSRVDDKLKILKNKSAITQEEITAWKSLRNSAAHGALHISEERLQKSLDQIYCAATLIYKLIFIAIGYRGTFLNYSIPGWPLESFNLESGNEIKTHEVTEQSTSLIDNFDACA
jgi:hypothetical protein